MRYFLKSLCIAVVFVAGFLSTNTDTKAQSNWPSAKPVTLVQPFAAGSDYLARLVGAALEARIGQKVIVENRPGAGGVTGTGYVSRQPADGYTLVMALPGPAANVTNTFSSLPYKPLSDFEYITRLSIGDMALIARKEFPANTLQELIAYAKANPGKISVGTNGVGSYGHMMGLMLADAVGITLKYVPYRGSPQIATDMMSGSLDLSSDYYGSSYVKHVEAGSLKVIAIPSESRANILPNTPTFREAGINITAVPWQGIMAPKGTPRPIIDKINAALKDYLTSDEARAKLDAVGQVPAWTTPEGFRDVVVREEAMWRDIIKKYDIRNE
jgi:tripartite-type tricarboxylate transporter receptor subunit TctC